MTTPRLAPLHIPPFNDLYNINIPEFLVTALVRHAVVDGVSALTDTPIVYEKIDDSVKKVKVKGELVETVQTRSTPDKRERRNEAFASALAGFGPRIKDLADQIADAVEDELWTRSENDSRSRRKVRAAIPLTPVCAVLQNQIGILGSSGANDYGAAIESLYQVGKYLVGDTSNVTASAKLQFALADRCRRDEKLSALDMACLALLRSALNLAPESLVYDQGAGRLTSPAGLPKRQSLFFDSNESRVLDSLKNAGDLNTYVWFLRTWNKLTNPEWYLDIPYRRWVDWLVTAVRLSVGTAYLARSQWMISAAKYSLRTARDDVAALDALINETFVQQPLSWPDRGGVSFIDRDVKPEIRKLLRTSVSIRLVVEGDEFQKALGGDDTVENLKRVVNADTGLAEQLEQALLTPSIDFRQKVLQPVYDTVVGALVDKTSGHGDSETADHYALMKQVDDAYIIDPSSEVMAIIATLACDRPDGFTSLGRVRQEFQTLGLDPSQNELRYLVERAGLCRSEADASLQVTVSSALRTASQL